MSTKEGRQLNSAPEEYSAPPLPDDRKALNDLTKLIPYLFCTFYIRTVTTTFRHYILSRTPDD
ncbi:hypothetical protein PENANT_c078G08975 [Penicillium antarcticum]|uniref:Uncharacterized protein n=1 Tax=Penicillium antarcticum TaxID=416450 RepID=A0A1V6PQ09_9EURO|nr:hypothetical protein PENANT_c078G08975 [Penicillium antarcticum]